MYRCKICIHVSATMQNIACTLFVLLSCAYSLLLVLLWEEVLTYSTSRKTFPKDIQLCRSSTFAVTPLYRSSVDHPCSCFLNLPCAIKEFTPGNFLASKSRVLVVNFPCQRPMLSLRLYKASFTSSTPPWPRKSGKC